MVTDEIVKKVFAAVFFQPTAEARDEVKSIIEDNLEMGNVNANCAATEICEFLEIGKTGNRPAIAEILQPLFDEKKNPATDETK